jgi:hypothetical protein
MTPEYRMTVFIAGRARHGSAVAAGGGAPPTLSGPVLLRDRPAPDWVRQGFPAPGARGMTTARSS